MERDDKPSRCAIDRRCLEHRTIVSFSFFGDTFARSSGWVNQIRSLTANVADSKNAVLIGYQKRQALAYSSFQHRTTPHKNAETKQLPLA